MTLDEEIRAGGRLDENQELMLYNMSLRQTSQRAAGGREGTHVLLSKFEGNPTYQEMVERGLLDCKMYGQGVDASTAAVTLLVTRKGLRYCVLYAEEIEPKRAYDVSGRQRFDAAALDDGRAANSGDVNYALLTSGMATRSSAAKNAAFALTDEQVEHFEKLGAQRRGVEEGTVERRGRRRAFASVTGTMKWESPSGDRWSYVRADDASVQVTGVDSASRSLHVPAEIEGGPVVAIAAGAFSMNDAVEEVVCPDSVELIGAGAFRQCSKLKRLVLPESVATFDSSWIARCPNLEELVLPGSLERIGRGVFENPGLKKLVIGRAVSEVEPGVFQGSQLEEVVVDDANPHIVERDGALYAKDLSVLLALVRPVRVLVVADGCRTLAKKSCYGCDELEEVVLPDSLVEVEPFAFAYSGLACFEAPASLEVIGEKAFFACRNLVEARLGDGLSAIGESSFEGSGLRALAIPATIKSLGRSMTRNTGIVHSGPESTLTIEGDCADLFLDGAGGLYRRCEDGVHLVQLVDGQIAQYRAWEGTVVVDPYAFAYNDSIESVSLPDSVRSIGRSAFRICRSLRRVELPDSIESIGDEAFLDTNLEEFRVPVALADLGERALVTYGAHHGTKMPSLAHVEVAPGNDSFYTACGMLCRRTGSQASVVIFTSSEARVMFPDEVTRVEDYAFCNARGIEYLALNPGLSFIGTNGMATRCWIRHIHVDMAKPIAGRTTFDFFFPNTPGALRGIALGLSGASWVNVAGLTEQLDLCLVSARDYNVPGKSSNISAYAQAKLILDRLDDPVMLTNGNRAMMERVLRNNIEDICVDVALYDDRSVLDDLVDRGFVNAENFEGVIERVGALRDAATSAFLLETKRQKFAGDAFDYDL